MNALEYGAAIRRPAPLILLLSVLLLNLVVMSSAHAQDFGTLKPEATSVEPDEPEELVLRQEGWFTLFGAISTGPGLYKRGIYQASYADASVTESIPSGLGTSLAGLRLFEFGMANSTPQTNLLFESAIFALLYAGVPGHREVTAALGIFPITGRLSVRPVLSVPVAIEVQGDLVWAPFDEDSGEGSSEDSNAAIAFPDSMRALIVSGAVHLKWQLLDRTFLGHRLLDAGLGIRYTYETGEFFPDSDFPGVRFTSEQVMLGGEISGALPTGKFAGSMNGEATEFPVGLFGRVGFYAGADGQFTVLASIDLRGGTP